MSIGIVVKTTLDSLPSAQNDAEKGDTRPSYRLMGAEMVKKCPKKRKNGIYGVFFLRRNEILLHISVKIIYI